MPHATKGDSDTTWLRGRKFRALGLSSLFLLSANPVLAHGAVGNLGGPVGISPPVLNHQLPAMHTPGSWHQSGFNLQGSMAVPLVHFLAPQAGSASFANPVNSLPSQGLNLDLTSSLANIVLGTNLFNAGAGGSTSNTATVSVGGRQRTFEAGQKVTAAEYVAIQEVLGGGSQTVTLNNRGAATGGSIDLDQVGSLKVSEIVIPKHVTALDNISVNQSLSLSGDLLNYGSIDGVSTNSKITSGTIAASDIINEAGGVITTFLPSNLEVANAVSGVNLTLSASNNIVNAGQISSAGALTLNAGGSITSALPSGTHAPGTVAPAISAAGDVNLLAGSGNFVNAGLISSTGGNVNFNTPAPQNINIAGSGGTVQALAGNINVRDASYSGANNTNLVGGDYLSHNLNVNSGSGAITGNIGQVIGNFNSTAGSDHVVADTAVFRLGSNTVSGDPLFVNTAGDIDITGPEDVTASGQPLTIVASGNIIATDPSAALINHGGDVTLVAGAFISSYTGTVQTTGIPAAQAADGNVTIDFSKTGSGGSIDLTASTATAVIDTSTNSGNGGNVTLAAYGAGGGSGKVSWSAGSSIDTQSLVGAGGSITVVAGFAGPGTAVSVGDVNTLGMTASSALNITNAQPTGNKSSTIIYDVSGAVDGASTSTAVVASNVQQGGDIVFASTAIGVGSINLQAAKGTVDLNNPNFSVSDDANGNGGSITINAANIIASGGPGSVALVAVGTGTGNGGSVTVVSANSLSLGTKTGEIAVSAFSGVNGGNGGTLNITTAGALTFDGPPTSAYNVTPTGPTGNGGNLIFNAQNLSLVNVGVNGLQLNAIGGNSGGNGGLVSLTLTGNSPISIGTAASDISMNASSLGNIGDGGTVILNSRGVVNFDSATPGTSFFASSVGSQGNAGNLSLTANGITWAGQAGTALTLEVDAQGNANGGTVSVTNISSQGLKIGTGGNQIQVIANGDGNGSPGTISLASGGTLTINPNGIQLFGQSGLNSNRQGGLNLTANKIVMAGSGPLTAGVINFVTGLSGGLGTLAAPIPTNTSNLTVSAAGDVFISNLGPVTVGTSSTPGTFNLSTTPDSGGNGSITIAHLAFISAGSINLQSSESGKGTGGISQFDPVDPQGIGTAVQNTTLYSGVINLSDSPGTGTGNGAIAVATSNDYGASNVQVNNTSGNILIFDGSVKTPTIGGFAGTSAGSQIVISTPGSLNLAQLPSKFSSLTINADTFGDGGTLSLPANKIVASQDSNGNGGTISLTADSISWSGGGALSLAANGSATGTGGSLSVNLLAATNVAIGTATTAGDFNFSATGKSGGSVFVSTLGNVSLDTSAVNGFAVPTGISVGPLTSGNGGNISLTASELSWSLQGTDALLLSAAALGAGMGGSVVIDLFNPSLPLAIGVGPNDVALNAAGGKTSGNGGSVVAETDGGLNTIFIDSGAGLNVAPASKTGDGGFIKLNTATLSNTSGAPLILNASAATGGKGNGGAIFLSIKNNLDLGVFKDGFELLAQGGSGSGNGGRIHVNSNSNLNFGASALAVAPLAANGNGGVIFLGVQNLTIDPSIVSLTLNASAKGTGNGGSVSVETFGADDVNVGNAAGNINLTATGANGGSLSYQANANIALATVIGKDGQATPTGLNGGPTGKNGNGGSIEIEGKQLSFQNSSTTDLLLNANGSGSGTGGSITLVSQAGSSIELGTGKGAFNLTAVGSSGGSISVSASAGQIFLDATVAAGSATPTGLNVSANSANGSGGSISLAGAATNSIDWTGSNASFLNLGVSGLGTGNGGTIDVELLGAAAVSIGTAPGDFSLSANSGSAGGNAGSIVFLTGGSLTIDNSASGGLHIAALGANGNGGSFSVNASTISALGGGPFTLDVSGKGTGNGGNITLEFNLSPAVTIGTGAGDFELIANSGATGAVAGIIDIQAFAALVTVDGAGLKVQSNTGTGGVVSIGAETLATSGTTPITAQELDVLQFSATNLQLNTQVSTLNVQLFNNGNVNIVNAGSVSLSSAGGVNNFSLVTTPGANGSGAITLTQSINIATSVTLVSSESNGGTGGISQQGGWASVSLNAPNITLSDQNASGGLGNGAIAIGTSSNGQTNLTISSTGSAVIFDRSNASINLEPSSANSLTLSSLSGGVSTTGASTFTGPLNIFTGDLTVNSGSSLTAGSITVRGFGGSAAFGQTATVNNLGTIQAGNVMISGASGNDLTVNNVGVISGIASNIYVVATPNSSDDSGGNLFITGGGTMSAATSVDGAVNLVASTSSDGNSANAITYSGNQTFNGTTNITAAGVNQSLVTNVGAVVTGNDTVNIVTPLWVDNGTLTGNPINFSGVNGGATIAQSSGAPLDLSALGDLSVTGTNLVILSAGDITDGGNQVDISTSNTGPGGVGGNVTLIAGFNFSPSATTPNIPDTTTTFIIPPNPTGSGNIELGFPGSGIFANGTVHAGNVSAYANGLITIGFIQAQASAGGGGAGGNVTMLGQGVTVGIGGINTQGDKTGPDGNVNITAASINTTGSIFVQAGAVNGGVFAPGTGSASNILIFGQILSGKAAVSLTALSSLIDNPIPIGGGKPLIVAGTLSINAGGDVGPSNAISSNAPLLTNLSSSVSSVNYISMAPTVTLSGNQSAGSTYTISGNSIVIGHGTVITSSAVNVDAEGSGGVTMADATGGINSPNLTLTTSMAGVSFGSSSLPLNLTNTSSLALTVNENTLGITGSVYLTSAASAASISSVGVACTNFSLAMTAATGGDINLTQVFPTSGKATLSTLNGNINLTGNGNVTGVNIDLEAPKGTINFGQTAATPLVANADASGNGGSVTVNANALTLNATASQAFNADATTGNIGGTVSVTVATGNVNVGGFGAVTLSAQGSGSALGQGGTVSFSSGGDSTVDASAINVGGTVPGTVNVTANSISLGSGVPLVGSFVNLTATGGEIGVSGTPYRTATPNLTVKAFNGDVFVTNQGSVTLGTSSAAAKLDIEITADPVSGNGQIIIGAGATLTASTIILNSTESGSGTGGISQVDKSQIVTITAPSITLEDNFSGGNGSIAVTTSQGFSPTFFEALTANTGSIAITTSSLTTGGGTIQSGQVAINGLIGQDLTINNSGFIEATSASVPGKVLITSTPDANDKGGNLFITGGGIMSGTGSGGGAVLTAATSADGLSSNVVEFTGSQNFNGANNATVNAPGVNQAVIVDAGATISGSVGALVINSPVFFNNGTVTMGIDFVSQGAGTYASNSAIDINTLLGSGGLTFHGQQLTILSGSDITDSNVAGSTIDLSNAGGNGGSLNLLAGFTFNPAASIGAGPDTTTAYAITATGTGNINLPFSNINTSSDNNGSTGGSVFAYANGSVNIGTIVTSNASGGTGLGTAGGSVVIIGSAPSGSAGVTVGFIETSGLTNGAVNISSASVALAFNGAGSSIFVLNGQVFGGSFQPGTYSGNINIGVGGINAASGSALTARAVNLNASEAAGTINATGLINTGSNGTVVLTAGSGGITSPSLFLRTDAAVITANSTGAVQILDLNTSSFTISGANSASSYEVINSNVGTNAVIAANASIVAPHIIVLSALGGITFAAGSTINTNDLALTTSGVLTVSPDTLTITAGSSGLGGTVSINNASNIVSNAGVGSTIAINANGTGTGNGGDILMSIVATGNPIVANANATGTGGGGIIELSSTSSVGTSTGGAFTANANGLDKGDGGIISLDLNTLGGAVVANANADFKANGGIINIRTTGNMQVGGAGNIQCTATGGTSSGNGGEVGLTSKNGTITFLTDATGNALGAGLGVNISALGANGSGGLLNLNGGDGTNPISWTNGTAIKATPLFLNVDGVGNGQGGQINLTLPTTATETIGNAVGAISMSAAGGANGGSGGQVQIFSVGTVNIIGNAINVGTQGANGSGGLISITAQTAVTGLKGQADILQANGTGLGDGGEVQVLVTGTNQTINVGNGASAFAISANAGISGGNAGTLDVENGGSLNVNPSFATATAAGNGSGALITFIAGDTNITSGALLVTGSINANGSGSGPGGSIVLVSNSATAFIVGSAKALSGVQGTLSVVGGAGGNGNMTAINQGGALTVVPAITAANNLDFESGKNGALTVSGNLGSASTNSITLSTLQPGATTTTGKLTSKTLQADTVNVTAGSQALTLIVNTSNLDFDASGKLTVTGVGSPQGTLNIDQLGGMPQLIAVKSPGNIDTAGAMTGGSVTIQSTSKTTGSISIVGGITTTTGAIALTAIGGISSSGGTLQSATTVTGTASGVGSGIAVDGITATGTKGAVTLTAAGSGASIQDNGVITSTGKVALTAAKGIIRQAAAGSITSNKSTVALTASSAENLLGSVTGLTGVTLKATGVAGTNAIVTGVVGSGNGSIVLTAVGGIEINGSATAGTTIAATTSGANSVLDVEQSLTAVGSKGAITLTASGAGGSITDNGNNTATGAIALTAAKGSVSQAATIIASNNGAVALKAGQSITQLGVVNSATTVTFTAGNVIDQSQGQIHAGTNAALKTTVASSDAATNFLAVNAIRAGNGSISVVGAGGKVSAVPGSAITAKSSGAKPAKATIIIEDSNTKAGTVDIVDIGAMSFIGTLGTLGGNVTICIGAPAAGIVGTTPAMNVASYSINGAPIVTTAPTTGQFAFGTNGITVVNGGAPGNVLFNSITQPGAKTSQVIFSTGKLAGKAIQVNGDNVSPTIITADPPPSSALLPVALIPAPPAPLLPVVASSGAASSSMGSGLSSGIAPVSSLSAPYASINPIFVSAFISAANSASQPGGAGTALLVSGRQASGAFDAAQLANSAPRSQFDWVSDTEIASGAIPAVLHSGSDLGIRPDVSSVLEMEECVPLLPSGAESGAPTSGPQDLAARSPLSGGISENIGKAKALVLRRGSVMFAPTEDTLVHTSYGTVSIAAHSLVLVIAYSQGVAVYDLDDKRQAGVKVLASGQTIVLAPGKSVVLTKDSFERFADINPAQMFAYRAVRSHNFGQGRKAFTADFSAMSAAHAVLPLRQLMRSTHPEAKRITNRLLKTTAIISQMQASAAPYQQYVRPSLSACAR